jgi:hypothetical protein
MKSLANWIIATSAAFSGIATTSNASEPISVRSVAEPRPCRSVDASVIGYLHVSRHGSWLSDDPGINGRGLPIRLAAFESPERKRLVKYIYRPQENMHNTFSAVFSGTTSCNDHHMPILEVHSVERIEVRPIRDAE